MQKLQQDFELNGFYVCRDVLSSDILNEYKFFLDYILKNDIIQIYRRYKINVSLNANNDFFNNLNNIISKEDKQILMGHFPLHARLSDKIHPVLKNLRDTRIINHILGSNELFMHMPPMMRYVLPGHLSAAVPPHQDLSYNPHLKSFVTVWIPLVKINYECGGLIVYEGSHDSPELLNKEGYRVGDWLPSIQIGDWKENRLVDLDLGDMVILSSSVVHASAPNLSNYTRISMDLRIFGLSGSSEKSYLDLQSFDVVKP